MRSHISIYTRFSSCIESLSNILNIKGLILFKLPNHNWYQSGKQCIKQIFCLERHGFRERHLLKDHSVISCKRCNWNAEQRIWICATLQCFESLVSTSLCFIHTYKGKFGLQFTRHSPQTGYSSKYYHICQYCSFSRNIEVRWWEIWSTRSGQIQFEKYYMMRSALDFSFVWCWGWGAFV